MSKEVGALREWFRASERFEGHFEGAAGGSGLEDGLDAVKDFRGVVVGAAVVAHEHATGGSPCAALRKMT